MADFKVEQTMRDGVGDSWPQQVCGTCAHFVPCSIKRCGRRYWDVGVCAVRMELFRDGEADMEECGRMDADGTDCRDWEEYEG